VRRTGWAALAIALAAVPAARADDTLLPIFYGAKLALSVLAAGTAVTDPDASAGERLVVGGASLMVGAPSAFVLAQRRRGNVAALRRWRIASFVVDAALSAVALGAGVSAWADPSSSLDDDYAGLALVSLGLAGALVSCVDLVPFEMERAASAR
jgi:hypothetical protein